MFCTAKKFLVKIELTKGKPVKVIKSIHKNCFTLIVIILIQFSAKCRYYMKELVLFPGVYRLGKIFCSLVMKTCMG